MPTLKVSSSSQPQEESNNSNAASAACSGDEGGSSSVSTATNTSAMPKKSSSYVKEIDRADLEAAIQEKMKTIPDEHEAEAAVRTEMAARSMEEALNARIADFDDALKSGGALEGLMRRFAAEHLDSLIMGSKLSMEQLVELSNWAKQATLSVRKVQKRAADEERQKRIRQEKILEATRVRDQMAEAARKAAERLNAYMNGDFSQKLPSSSLLPHGEDSAGSKEPGDSNGGATSSSKAPRKRPQHPPLSLIHI